MYTNGSMNGALEGKLDGLQRIFGKADGDRLRIVGVGAGASGRVFIALLQIVMAILETRF